MVINIIGLKEEFKNDVVRLDGKIVAENDGLIDCQFDTRFFTIRISQPTPTAWEIVKIRNVENRECAHFYSCEFSIIDISNKI